MEARDYYAILMVPPTATAEQIERAYKRLVSITHPDVFPNDPQAQAWANERMKQINEAYAVLSDPTKRSDYDRPYAERKTAHERSHPEQRQQHREREQYREPRVPCPTCGQRGRIPCLVCEGYGDADCPGCQGQRSTVCPLCLGVGTLTEAKHREHVAEQRRAQEQARAQAARQEAEAAARRRETEARRKSETGRRIAVALSPLVLLILLRGCLFERVGRETAPAARRDGISPPVAAAPPKPARLTELPWNEDELRKIRREVEIGKPVVAGHALPRSFLIYTDMGSAGVQVTVGQPFQRLSCRTGIDDRSASGAHVTDLTIQVEYLNVVESAIFSELRFSDYGGKRMPLRGQPPVEGELRLASHPIKTIGIWAQGFSASPGGVLQGVGRGSRLVRLAVDCVLE